MTEHPKVVQDPPLRLPFYYGWAIVAVASVSNLGLAPLTPLVFSFFVKPMSEDLGWSLSAMSIAYSIRYLAGGLASPFLGRLVDRHGSRWLGVVAGLIGTGALIGFSAVHDLWVFYLLWGIVGICGIGGGPGAHLLTMVPVAKWFVASRGRAMAVTGGAVALGAAISIPIARWLIDAHGWRTAWFVFALAFFVLTVPLFALFMRRAPEDFGLQPPQPGTASFGSAKATASAPAPEVHWTAGEAMRTRTLWQVLIAFSLIGFSMSGMVIYRTAFWEDVGIEPNLLAFSTALDPFMVVIAGLAFGVFAERIGPQRLGLLAAGGYGLAMLPMIFATDSAAVVLAHNFMLGFFSGPYMATHNTIWPAYFGRRFLGSIQGIAIPFTIFWVAIGGPVYGLFLDAGVNPRIMWTVSLVLCAIAAFLLYTAKRPSPRFRDAGTGRVLRTMGREK